jgi:SLAM family protein 7
MEQEGEDVIYSWKALGQAANVSHDGPILPISWRLEEKDMTFICMARNPISSSSSQPIRTWSLCKGDCLLFPQASGLSHVFFSA